MANVNINIRMDNDIRHQFETGAESPNIKTFEAIEEIKRMKEDPSIGKTYSDVDQMMEELL